MGLSVVIIAWALVSWEIDELCENLQKILREVVEECPEI
jgi:hypothetical protein